MRLHIQLLTQSGLLSAGSKELQDVHQDSRNMLSELVCCYFIQESYFSWVQGSLVHRWEARLQSHSPYLPKIIFSLVRHFKIVVSLLQFTVISRMSQAINFLNEWGDECPLEADQRKTLKKFELSARLMVSVKLLIDKWFNSTPFHMIFSIKESNGRKFSLHISKYSSNVWIWARDTRKECLGWAGRLLDCIG